MPCGMLEEAYFQPGSQRSTVVSIAEMPSESWIRRERTSAGGSLDTTAAILTA